MDGIPYTLVQRLLCSSGFQFLHFHGILDIMSGTSEKPSTELEPTRRPGAGKESDSNYALQIALKHMKERCQKQQSRIQVLEEENKRLIQNKSELYQEIGKLQENNIRLRERNLALNHEVHSKHQESVNMRESISSLSRDHATCNSQLTSSQNDCENLKNRLSRLTEENKELKRRSGGLHLPGFSHVGVQTDNPSPSLGRATIEPQRAQSPLGRLLPWIGRRQNSTRENLPSLELTEEKPPSVKETEEKNGFLVIEVTDSNGNKTSTVASSEMDGELKENVGTAQLRSALLREIALRQRDQLKKCIESVRLVERNAGNRILRLDSSSTSKDSGRELDRDCSSLEISASDQQRYATQSNSSTTLDLTYGTCPRCDCKLSNATKTEEKAVSTVDSSEEESVVAQDALVTLMCPAEVAPIDRVCPMCEASFSGERFSQTDFEAHVVEHFEAMDSLVGDFEDLGLSMVGMEPGATVFDVRS